MTLTKAELADLLFEQLGLNKREAKDMVSSKSASLWNQVTASSCPASATSSSERNRSARGAIPRPAKKFRSPRDAS